MREVTFEELLEVGAHFGHQAKRWNPKAKQYIYGVRDGIHIFDLIQTKQKLEEAYKYLVDLTAQGKTVIFVGTKRQASEIVVEEAKRAGAFFVAERWLGGIITNWEQVRKSINQLTTIRREKEEGKYKKYTKKENLLIDRKATKLDKFLGGLVGLAKEPDALFIVDLKNEMGAVKEARKKGIPIVAMADTNADPTLADYPIPINDDAVKSVKLVVALMADAVLEGKEILQRQAKKTVEEGKTKK